MNNKFAILTVCFVLATLDVSFGAEACPRVRDIKTWSFYDQPGEDTAFDRFRFTSVCDDVLLKSLTSRKAMPYLWYNQRFIESDAAIFLLLRKYGLQFLHVLPSSEEEGWRQQGIYSYFAYVEERNHRTALIARLLQLIEDVKQGRRPPKRDEH